MPGFDRTSLRNRLLLSLSEGILERLAPHLSLIELPVRMELVEPFVATSHAIFIESGLASIVASSDEDHKNIEVGHIGWEGMSGIHLLLDTDQTANRTFMQTTGSGLRLHVDILRDFADRNASLRALLLRYVHSYHIQLSQTALANGRYTMNQRLARWLLMYHDRLQGDFMPVTHEFLSLMLGVRRSGVTNEIHILEGVGIIKASRAMIQILDRPRLEDVAGGSYGVSEAEYERLIGQTLRRSFA